MQKRQQSLIAPRRTQNEPKREKNCHRVVFLLLYAPALLWGIHQVTGIEVDVPLDGFTDAVATPTLNLQSIADGSFQSASAKYIETVIPLRGVYTKTYNTLQYGFFRLGSPNAQVKIGGHNTIFGSGYLEAALSIGDAFDFSSLERVSALEETVAHMVSANQKLETVGKHLYVYLAPGKPELYPEDVPAKYPPMGNPDSPTALETMTALLKDTDIPCMFCEEFAEDLEYPAYYPTGIHWSRTYEQTVSQRLISEFSALTGKVYKNLQFTGVEESNTPFLRDVDGYSLLNIWYGRAPQAHITSIIRP